MTRWYARSILDLPRLRRAGHTTDLRDRPLVLGRQSLQHEQSRHPDKHLRHLQAYHSGRYDTNCISHVGGRYSALPRPAELLQEQARQGPVILLIGLPTQDHYRKLTMSKPISDTFN